MRVLYGSFVEGGPVVSGGVGVGRRCTGTNEVVVGSTTLLRVGTALTYVVGSVSRAGVRQQSGRCPSVGPVREVSGRDWRPGHSLGSSLPSGSWCRGSLRSCDISFLSVGTSHGAEFKLLCTI